MPSIVRLISGGQTGADRAALDVAIACGLRHGGWCPRGGWAEDFPTPPGLLVVYPQLRETASAEPDVRTRLNVRDSDATLVVRREGAGSPGTALTLRVATELGRPLLVTAGEPALVTAWLAELGPGLTLNVAGPRESEQPGTHELTGRLLRAVLDRARPDGR